MDLVTIVTVGIIATAYMTLLHWLVERRKRMRSNLMRTIGSFVIPEHLMAGPAVTLLLHFAAGIVFTAAYAFIFDFVRMPHFRSYLSLGAVIGLAHGFFLVFFTSLGFSSFVRADRLHPSSAEATILHLISHVLFGTLVGMGFAFRASMGTPLWFGVYGLLGILGIAGLATLFSSPVGAPRRMQKNRMA